MGKIDDAKKLAEKKTADKQNAKKGDKPKSNRLLNFFRELKAELKRIIWPDKKKMKQSTSVVLAIVFAAAILIFAVDSFVNASLTAAGFYNTTPRVTTTAAADESPSEDETSTTTSTSAETTAVSETTTAG